MTEPAPESLRHARHAFRDARRAMAAAVLAGDRRATVVAAWAVLHAGDHLRAINACPSARDRRMRVRWRRWALQALRRDPPDFGLLRRSMALNSSHNNPGAAGAA
ncbi:MAG: hypothetical protein JNJ62_03665 [Pseudoxanthomonas mexicana]|nr:hypothetical protein [Pseudoxanthomonas mexicana]